MKRSSFALVAVTLLAVVGDESSQSGSKTESASRSGALSIRGDVGEVE